MLRCNATGRCQQPQEHTQARVFQSHEFLEVYKAGILHMASIHDLHVEKYLCLPLVNSNKVLKNTILIGALLSLDYESDTINTSIGKHCQASHQEQYFHKTSSKK